MARALWKGAISFGLVTIPVALYPAKSSDSSIDFHLLHKEDLSRIRNQRVDEEGHEVPYEEVVRGYEYEKDRYVVIDDEDLRTVAVEGSQSIDIMHFVDLDAIDLAYYDTPYYTEPSKAGRKAYALLRETLRSTGKAGVATLAVRDRQRLCAVIAAGPALLACTLRWPDQLRDASEFDLPPQDLDEIGVSPEELKMAGQLVETMSTPWQPERYRDTYREDLLRIIEQKVESGTVTEPPTPREEVPADNVVDIMTLLKRSLEGRERGGQASYDTPKGKRKQSSKKSKAG